MGQTKTHHPSESSGWSAFNDFVEQRPGVCQNCYTLVRKTVKTYDPQELKKSLRHVLTDEVEKTKYAGDDFRGLFEGGTSHGFSATYKSDKRTYCQSCGSDKKFQLSDPISLEIMEELSENVYSRLDETDGISIKKSELVNEVVRMKEAETYSDMNDRRIIRQAADSVVEVDHSELPE